MSNRDECLLAVNSLSGDARARFAAELIEELPGIWVDEALKIACQLQADEKTEDVRQKAMDILTRAE